MKTSLLPALAVLAVLTIPAGAQTANSMSTAPSGGTSRVYSTTSTGTVLPKPGLSKTSASTALEQSEQRKSDKDMNICTGC